MVWIKPRETTNSRQWWFSIRENAFFELLQNRVSSVPVLGGFFGSVAANVAVAPYRIVVKNSVCTAVAESHSLDEINTHWRWIETNIRLEEHSKEAERDDVIEFLLLKFESMVCVNTEEKAARDEQDFNSTFGLNNETLVSSYPCSLWVGRLLRPGRMYFSDKHVCFSSKLLGSPIVIPFGCVKALNKRTTALGTVDNSIRIATTPGVISPEAAVAGSSVTSSSTNSPARAGSTPNVRGQSRASTTTASGASSSASRMVGGDFFFVFYFGRDEVFDLLDEIWNNSMYALLKRTEGTIEALERARAQKQPEAYDRTHAKEVLRAHERIQKLQKEKEEGGEGPSSADDGDVTGIGDNEVETLAQQRKRVLQQQSTNRHFLTRLRLPASERLVSAFDARLWLGGTEQLFVDCDLLVFRHFLCISATKSREDTITIVVPYREVRTVCKGEADPDTGRCLLEVVSKGTQVTQRKLLLSVLEVDTACRAMTESWRATKGKGHPLSRTSALMPACEGGIGQAMLDDPLHFSQNYRAKQVAQRELWAIYFRDNGHPGSCMLERSERFNALVRGGVPDDLRGMVWLYLSGAAHKAYAESDGYASLLSLYHGQEWLATDEIDRDLCRSFPEHPYYHTDEGIQTLRNVLVTYSWRNPAIGYCQSMNIVTAVLLFFMSEEAVFWTMTCLCEELVPENYDKNMLGSVVDQMTFERLLTKYLPDVSAVMEERNIPVGVISQPWFLCFFVGYVSLELGIRVIDCFLNEGIKTLFAVGIALFDYHAEAVMACDQPNEITNLFKVGSLAGIEDIMSIAFEYMSIISDKEIAELRNMFKISAIKQMDNVTRDATVRELMSGRAFKNIKFEKNELATIYDLYQAEVEIERGQKDSEVEVSAADAATIANDSAFNKPESDESAAAAALLTSSSPSLSRPGEPSSVGGSGVGDALSPSVDVPRRKSTGPRLPISRRKKDVFFEVCIPYWRDRPDLSPPFRLLCRGKSTGPSSRKPYVPPKGPKPGAALSKSKSEVVNSAAAAAAVATTEAAQTVSLVFDKLVTILYVIRYGTLEDRFRLCYTLHIEEGSNERKDVEKEGRDGGIDTPGSGEREVWDDIVERSTRVEIDNADLYRVLDALLRIYCDNVATKDIHGFVTIAFAKACAVAHKRRAKIAASRSDVDGDDDNDADVDGDADAVSDLKTAQSTVAAIETVSCDDVIQAIIATPVLVRPRAMIPRA
eukprot:TRINITY_DN3159_c0_g1_i1.p1 TRINITY_DN3159_c0_g1~~TRINITY_DN3159_c0_g1_i1.p1  ORF type:complete len:1218 (-),score=295.29 TRINITY_DN3159_c0_g1_i1:345-3998(-)